MPNFVSFREAVTAYASGATVWLFSDGNLVHGICWDLPRDAFQDPIIRAEAARACSRNLRRFIRCEDPEVKSSLTW